MPCQLVQVETKQLMGEMVYFDSQGYCPRWREVLWHGPEMAGHTASTVRKQRTEFLVLSQLSLLNGPGSPSPLNGTSHIYCVFSYFNYPK